MCRSQSREFPPIRKFRRTVLRENGGCLISRIFGIEYSESMNMFKPVGAKNIKEYFALLTDDRRKELKAIDAFIKKVAPTLKPNFSYNMLGYGVFRYRNYKNDIIDWPVLGLASQKNYISLYVCAIDKGEYIAERHKDELGKVTVGKSCIRFKKFEDVNMKALEKVLKLAVKSPGL